jgi:glycosyltransferase involved in cell wall biosynthesis
VIRFAVDAAGKRTNRRLDVVFVAPLVSGISGGVSAIFNMEDACARDGLQSAVVLTLNSHDAPPRHVTPFPQFDAFLNAVESVGHVVCTSNETVAAAQYLSKIYGAELVHFIMGPEVAFGGGAWARATLHDYRAANRLIVVSDYLSNYLNALGAPSAQSLNYGPSTHIFFDRRAPRTERSVVLYAGGALEKGPGLAAVTASVFINAGWSVHVVGPRAGPGWPSGVILHGHTPSWKLAHLFNTTQYYVDTSMYDGLGMMILEAAFCGSVPVTLRNGGASAMLEAHDAGILLSGPAALLDLPLSLPADYEAFRRQRQRGVAALRRAVSLEAAYAQAPGSFTGEAPL